MSRGESSFRVALGPGAWTFDVPLDWELWAELLLCSSEREDVEEPSEDAAAVNQRSAADEDSVFMRSYIPRTLNEVYDPERDVGVLNRGEGEKLIYKDTIGIVAPKDKEPPVDGKRTVQFADDQKAEATEDAHDSASGQSESEDEEDEESDEGEGEQDGDFKERKPRGHRHEDKEAKKVCFISYCMYTVALKPSLGAQKGREGGGSGEEETQDSKS